EDVRTVKHLLHTTKISVAAGLLDQSELEGSSEALKGKMLEYLARRPDFDQARLRGLVADLTGGQLDQKEIAVALNDLRYSGYLKDQESLAKKRGRYEGLEIPSNVDFELISGLSREAVQKFGKVRPRTIGQAARIPGITPAAVSILLIEVLRG
ncbi:MAG: hypothetical protein ACREAC_25180, partial [Blastocatellia bacterium]